MKCTPLASKEYQPAPLRAAAVAFAIELALLRVDEIVLAGHVVHVEPRHCEMMCSASSNSDGFDRCEMSPVWIMKDGFTGSA